VTDEHDRLGRGIDDATDILGPSIERDLRERRAVAPEARQVGRDDLVTRLDELRHDLVPAPRAVPGAVNEHERSQFDTLAWRLATWCAVATWIIAARVRSRAPDRRTLRGFSSAARSR
jgi:hypothetical protein